jgi:5-methyltetrahydropteroyltriglutamate--homocysteine methyltransferase
MQHSDGRILTTHTGSLPRPTDLTLLHVARQQGKPVDTAEFERVGLNAVRRVVVKQRDAGIAVGNNGEQQRDSFFLYLTERLTGLGGSWNRPTRADIDRYPIFREMWNAQGDR